MRKLLFTLTVLCLILSACAGNTNEAAVEEVETVDCSSSDYNQMTASYLEEWESVMQKMTTRISGNCQPLIDDLERIMGDFKGLDVASCYQSAHEKNLAAMQLDLDGMKHFDTTGEPSEKHKEADADFAAAKDEVAKLDQ